MATKNITIHGNTYIVEDGEFAVKDIPSLYPMKIISNVSTLDREIALIKKLSTLVSGITSFVNYGSSYGDYVPLNLSSTYSMIHIVHGKDEDKKIPQIPTVLRIEKYMFKKAFEHIDSRITTPFIIVHDISELTQTLRDNANIVEQLQSPSVNVLDKYKLYSMLRFHDILSDYHCLSFMDTRILIHRSIINTFRMEFGSYMSDTELKYDNLVNLCIMVKNGDKGFKNMLEHNIQFADTLTVLDTGSTDGTVKVVRDILNSVRYLGKYMRDHGKGSVIVEMNS